jgi:hypothetical protein
MHEIHIIKNKELKVGDTTYLFYVLTPRYNLLP